jgi:hypothetical protein
MHRRMERSFCISRPLAFAGKVGPYRTERVADVGLVQIFISGDMEE